MSINEGMSVRTEELDPLKQTDWMTQNIPGSEARAAGDPGTSASPWILISFRKCVVV